MSYYLGIDPGQQGGIAILLSSGEVDWLRKMPDTEREIWELVDNLPLGDAVLELVRSRPGQSSVATFKFGWNYGFIRGCLIAAEISFIDIRPQDWQRALKIPKVEGEDYYQRKKRLKSIAQQRFPTTNITNGTADALLIAEYCRIHHQRPLFKG